MGLGDLNPVHILQGEGAIGESGLGSLVVGAGLAAMGIPPVMAALYTGGATAALTGSLQKGLFAGMGAYGGAGLEAGLAGLGAEGATTEAAKQAAQAEAQAGAGALKGAGYTPEIASGTPLSETSELARTAGQDYTTNARAMGPSPINAAQTGQTVQTTTQAPGLFDRAGQSLSNAGAGLERLTSSGGIDALRAQMATGAGLNAPSMNMAAGTAAAGALGSGLLAQKNPAADAKKLDPGYIRQFDYDPYSQKYTALTPVKADQWGARSFQDAYRAADGGIVALAHGGDVRRFDDGGVATAPQSVTDLYQQVLGRAPDTGGAEYWAKQFGDTIDPNEIATFKGAAQAELANRSPAEQMALAPNLVGGAQEQVSNMYRNVLGRDPDPSGLQYWSNRLVAGDDPNKIYNDLQYAAKQNTELGNYGLSLEQATSPYSGYKSADQSNIADEWVRNVLGREVSDADRQQQWYKDALSGSTMNSVEAAKNIYGQFQNYASDVGAKTTAEKIALARQTIAAKGLTDADVYAQTGKTIEQLIGAPKTDLDVWHASQLLAPGSAFDFASLQGKTPTAAVPSFTSGTTPYGNATNPGDITISPDGSRTVTPNIPGRPYGGFSSMDQVKAAYTQGGGSLGYTPYAPKTAAEHAALYNKQTGGSRAAFDYLMGGAPYPIAPSTPTGEVYKPYGESVLGIPADPTARAMLWDAKARRYVPNPQYVKPMTLEEKTAAAEKAKADAAAAAATSPLEKAALTAASQNMATGGIAHLASGGLGTLGGYSDGGRLLKGPGDGVSDSIPASIGNKQPARLADGEFVVPARIVSELGNGSTDAGARKLYAMMDRVQKARGKTTGKGKVATNSRADKYLPV